jgi:hypothetical protein
VYSFFRNDLAQREASVVDVGLHQATIVETGCGMWLYRPPLHNGGYVSTPVNTLMFASTGGDGCHFSFLLTQGKWSEESPIVMTCPDAGCCENVLVGQNLSEFLRLGLRTGYFALNELARGWESEEFNASHPFVEELEKSEPAPWVEPEEAALLAHLARRFSLSPRPEVGRRLAELQRLYLPVLTYSERYYSTFRESGNKNG